MKEKIVKKGITKKLFSIVLALALVIAYLPMDILKVNAAVQCDKCVDCGDEMRFHIGGRCLRCGEEPGKGHAGTQCALEVGHIVAHSSTKTHDHGNFATVWSNNAAGHWHACGNGDCDVNEIDVSSHTADGFAYATHSGGTATCQAKAVCSVCSAEYGEKAAHDYGYSATNNVLTASCKTSGCTESHTLTLSASSANYSGSLESPVSFESTDAWTDAGLTLPNIYYEGTGTTTYSKSTTAPTALGTYEASITMDDATAKVEFSISEKMNEIASSVDIDVPVYAQVAASGSTYNVRFVYAIDKTAIDNLSEVGLVCELVGGEKLTMSGTEVFSTVMAGSTEISDPNKYYAVFEIKNVDVDSTFKVNTIVKSADDTTTEGSTVYSYTLTAN